MEMDKKFLRMDEVKRLEFRCLSKVVFQNLTGDARNP